MMPDLLCPVNESLKLTQKTKIIHQIEYIQNMNNIQL